MPKFAVYYVPGADTIFYKLGSAILGYDVRKEKLLPESSVIKSTIGEIDPQWQIAARPFGFHLTIGDSIIFDLNELSKIEAELQSVLDCFAPGEEFILTRNHLEFIPDWGSPIVLRYDSNDHLKAFHALIVSCINTMGMGSGYLNRYRDNPGQHINEPYKAARVEKFFSPNILGDFKPHFTLLNPYKGSNRSELVQKLEKIFIRFEKLTINSICLLIQRNADENWVIHREFER